MTTTPTPEATPAAQPTPTPTPAPAPAAGVAAPLTPAAPVETKPEADVTIKKGEDGKWPTLEQAMLAVQRACGDAVAMSGENTHAKYNYSKDTDYIKHVRKYLNQAGIRIHLQDYEIIQQPDANKVIGYVIFRISHPDSAQTLDRKIMAEANDKQDKAVGKFLTQARKQLLKSEFLLASDESEDTEHTTANRQTAGAFEPKEFMQEIRDSVAHASSVPEINTIWTLNSTKFKRLQEMDKPGYDTLIAELSEAKKKAADAAKTATVAAAPVQATVAPTPAAAPAAAPAPAPAPEPTPTSPAPSPVEEQPVAAPAAAPAAGSPADELF